MAIENVLAAMAVSDIERAKAWYAKLLGRPADKVPMAEAAEWRLTDGGWIQLVQSPQHAGHSMVTVNVDDIEEFVAQAGSRGVSAKATAKGDGPYRLAQVVDPDGNVLTFSEDQRVDHHASATGSEQLTQPWVGGA